MLKIEDNVDLKELEEFGLKAKYDEDTGEVKFFYIDRCKNDRTYHLKFNKKRKEEKKFFTIFKRDKCNKDTNYISIPYYEKENRIFVRNSHVWEYVYYDFDTLYDLIKAGLVEKVGD